MLPEVYVPHVLAAAVLVARTADLGSTYLGTPNLMLEQNEFARRYRWPFGFATLGFCFVPYFDEGLGIVILVMSLLVAASNMRQVWLVRAIGEADYLALLQGAAKRIGRRAILGSVITSSLLNCTAGALLWLFYPIESRAGYFALGVLAYGGATALHGSSFAARLLKAEGDSPAA